MPGAGAQDEEQRQREAEERDRYQRQNVATARLRPAPLTERPDRRTLHSESAGHPPVFPELDPIRGRDTLGVHDRHLRGEEFKVRPGLVDTDSISDPGVGARLIYSTVLPLDEPRFTGITRQITDDAERLMIEVRLVFCFRA